MRRPSRRTAFLATAAVLAALFGIVFFGLVALVLAWFQPLEGVAGPVTDLGYGALVGIILTFGLLAQLRMPERRIAAMQQVVLVIPALVLGSALAWDSQDLIPALILLSALGLLLVLHPARSEFLARPESVSAPLLVLVAAGALPLIAYALDAGAQARELAGPPHHVQRLSTMAALAIAILLVGVLAGLRTEGWRVPAWSAGSAAVVFGLASLAHPDHPGAAGRWWAGLAVAGGALFVSVAEVERHRDVSGSDAQAQPLAGRSS